MPFNRSKVDWGLLASFRKEGRNHKGSIMVTKSGIYKKVGGKKYGWWRLQ